MDQIPQKRTARMPILFGFLLAITIVAGACYWAYDRVNTFANTVIESTGSENSIQRLRDIVSVVAQAENHVLRYVMTRDTLELEYYAEQVDTLFGIDIVELVEQDTSLKKPADELADWVDQKLQLEEEILVMAGDSNIKSTYQIIYNDLEKVLSNIPANSSSKSSKRQKGGITQTKPGGKIDKEPQQPNNSPITESQNTSENEIAPKKPTKFHFFGVGLNPDEKEALKAYKEQRKKERQKRREAKKNKSLQNSSLDPLEGAPLDTLIAKTLFIPIKHTDEDRGDDLDPQQIERNENILRILQDSVFNIHRANQQILPDSIVNKVIMDHFILQKIADILREMEDLANQRVKDNAKLAKEQAQNTPIFIAIFGGVMLLVFIILLWIIFRDINRNQKLQRDLAAQTERAHKLANAREEFLANMSHDIRTPMNAIIGFADQLLDTPLNEIQDKFLHTIRHSGRYLLGLINDVLDYSKLESGSFELEFTDFSPSSVLDEVYETFQGEAEKKGLKMSCKYGNKLPKILIGDPLRLKQMLFNLTNNALKFTQKGAVAIECKVEKKQKEWVFLQFSVKDTGIGIPKEKLNAIFQEYGQVDSSTTRKFGGTGLGLSITQKLAEKHGGKIEVESTEGKGTTFFITIPYKISQQQYATPPEAAPKELTTDFLQGKQFLIADDEPFNRFLLETILEKWGVEADSVENGREAVEKAKLHLYDFILIDLQMPEMDGMQATRHIRQELKQNMPIIALTATSTPKEVEESMRSGIDDVLLKPFQEQVLLQKLFDISEGNHEPSIVQEIFNNMPRYQLDELYKLTGNNKKSVLHLLEIFARDTPTELRLLQKSIKTKDWQALSNAAHKLIPKVNHLVPAMAPRLRFIKEEADNKQNLDQLPGVVKEVTRQLIEIIVEVEKDIEKLKKSQ